MPRIFACLAIGQIVVLAGTFVLGALSPGVGGGGLRDRHIVLAVFALLLICLVQTIGFTYLIVTGKLIAQAVHLAKLPAEFDQQARGIKRRFTRMVLVAVLVCTLGAATGGNRWRLGPDHWLHGGAAALLLVAVSAVLVREFALIAENAGVVQRVLTDYNRRGGKAGTSAESAVPSAVEPAVTVATRSFP